MTKLFNATRLSDAAAQLDCFGMGKDIKIYIADNIYSKKATALLELQHVLEHKSKGTAG